MATELATVVMNQQTVGTLATTSDILVMLAAVAFMIFVMYLGNKMNAQKIFKISTYQERLTARLMRK